MNLLQRDPACQGKFIRGMDSLKSWPEQDWRPETRPPLHRWLSHTIDDTVKSRLEAIGNVVMPAMAFMAINLIGHGFKS